MKTAEELREEFIKKYTPSILDKNSNTSFVIDLATLLEFHASLREKETAIEFLMSTKGETAVFMRDKYEQNFEEWYTKHKEG